MADVSTPPDEIVARYSNGRCMWLALALHERYGWQIRAQIEHDLPEHGGDYVAHAYCVLPDGREADVLGIQDSVDLFSTDEVRDFTPEGLLAFIKADPASAKAIQEMADAHAVIDRYLADPVVIRGPK